MVENVEEPEDDRDEGRVLKPEDGPRCDVMEDATETSNSAKLFVVSITDSGVVVSSMR